MERIDVVDDNNLVIGSATRKEIYEKKLTHRIVHIILVNPEEKKVFLQRRSDSVDFLPGYYCTSAGGHVQSGESFDEAAARESREEIGLEGSLKKINEMQFVEDDHKRFIGLYLAYTGGELDFKDGEVSGGDFFNMNEAYELVARGGKIHPQLDFCYRWLFINQDLI